MKWISPGYFETMGTRLVAGRHMTWTDVYRYAPVVVVNERFARQYWKQPGDAIGKRLRETSTNPWREIIGIVADERQDGVHADAPPIVYWPCLVNAFFTGQPSSQRSLVYVIRSTRTGSPAFVDEIRQAVRAVDKSIPLAKVRSVDEIAAASTAQTSFAMVMLAIAGAVSLLLSIVGIYGVIAYIAAQRTREVGIRMALGAQAGDVVRVFAGHGFLLAAVGVVVGTAAAAALSRLMASMLFGVSAIDPATYLAAAVTMSAVAVLAAYLPSRHAARLDPMAALRSDT
jgi:predicted permease